MEHGIHELTAGYALDALDPGERRAYEEHLPGCERCRKELSSFWEVTGALALAATGPEPSPTLRERILESARAEPQNVIPLRRRTMPSSRLFAAVAAVAAVVAIGLGVWAVALHHRLDRTRNELASQRASVSVIADPSAREVSLQTGRGRLVVAPDGRTVLVVDGTTPAPSGRTYEVWVIRQAHPKAPVPAGLFHGGGRSVVPVSLRVSAGDVVTVTLERAGGVDAPTTAPVVASHPV